MNNLSRHFCTDLAIIGSGLTGMAASIFAINRGISCSLTGNTGAVAYTSGYLDLLGYIDAKLMSDPWKGLSQLQDAHPGHPLSQINGQDIANAFQQFTAFLGDNGIGYTPPGTKNIIALTPAGTTKPTLCLPRTMEHGVLALQTKSPCTILGLRGLKGFSSRQIQANLKNIWPDLKAGNITFPGHERGELYAEVAARSLEVPQNRKLFAEILKKAAGNHLFVGLPAVLGIHAPDAVRADLEKLTGLSLFEIPTMPPSVAGTRLREMFEQVLPQKGVTLVPQQKVKKIIFTQDAIEMQLADNYGPIGITAKTAILATGRFLSGGLVAHLDHIAEPLAGLAVHQPASRHNWYREEYMDKQGHSIHTAGIEVDRLFRPLGHDGQIVDERLFAAGIVLAHQDWIRQRCGAGVALATALKAVEAAGALLRS